MNVCKVGRHGTCEALYTSHRKDMAVVEAQCAGACARCDSRSRHASPSCRTTSQRSMHDTKRSHHPLSDAKNHIAEEVVNSHRIPLSNPQIASPSVDDQPGLSQKQSRMQKLEEVAVPTSGTSVGSSEPYVIR
jgi:hypothetical protein